MENVGTFYGHFVYIIDIWYISWPFGNLVIVWYFFSRFGTLFHEKSGNPGTKNFLPQV
jgi:hypothetical protein